MKPGDLVRIISPYEAVNTDEIGTIVKLSTDALPTIWYRVWVWNWGIMAEFVEDELAPLIIKEKDPT